MRLFYLLVVLLIATPSEGQGTNVKLISWNIRDLGRSKSDAEIELMAQVLRGFDVIAIQEVVAKDPAGAKAVARLADALDRTGADYDYRVSNPTQSSSPHVRERYAFIWKTSTVRLLERPKLLSAFAKTVEREPYVATFSWEGKPFRVVNFHARPYDQQPEQEVAEMRSLLTTHTDMPLFLLGDFNLVSRHSVFNPWRNAGYTLAVENQKTTLRRAAGDTYEDYLSRENDNILVPSHQVQKLEGGALDVVAYLRYDLAAATALSDHLPVYVIFDDFPQLDGGQ